MLAMFCVGFYAMLAQMFITREMLVVFSGNELSIGIALSAWLAAIGLGAAFARLWVERVEVRRLRWLLAVLPLWMALILPAQIALIRGIRAFLSVAVGEAIPPLSMLGAALLILLPSCAAIGIAFPCACRLAALERPFAVSRIYRVESFGSMLGGALFSFVLAARWNALLIALFTSLAALLGAALLAPERRARRVLSILLLGGAALAACPRCLDSLQQRALEFRWRASGVLVRRGAPDTGVRLVASLDSRYQNLAVTAMAGQYTLYANGEVMSVFPDPAGYEHAVHFIMAQKPDARRILLLGGNPVGHLPELRRYPAEAIVCVELDEAVGRIVRSVAPAEYRRAMDDSRVKLQIADGPHFVRNCREQFDAILILAPPPTTAALNRYYTLDFYRAVRRLLAPRGFVYTALDSSERLEVLAAQVTASVYRSLREAFDVVLVTAGAPTQFFASLSDGPLTFDRERLYRQSQSAQLATWFFRPDYFRFADEIDSAKTTFVRQRLDATPAPLNTDMRPVSYYYYLILWSHIAGSQTEAFLARILAAARSSTAVSVWALAGTGAAAAVLLLFVALAVRHTVSRQQAWRRSVSLAVILLTGFATMALEMILILLFQNLYGYIYARLGLIVAIFMLGLVAGARTSESLERGTWRQIIARLAAFETLLLMLTAALPAAMNWMAQTRTGIEGRWLQELLLYACVGLSGWVGGVQFPLVNRIAVMCGSRLGHSAALTDALDHLGAALGSLAVGVIAVPVFGLAGACGLLVLVQAVGLAALLSAGLSATADSA
jgi:spermidine synthase